ncbi:MAG: [FeFe] hydrogenase H-cluster radical SAM maturase HydG [Planctomycetaceae bacterium]|jgi:2-iminoacetate synthase|nr:[FeFe] hydrogenase H-cluster radical SAM maturase HydG [Planctomycetaceae bacterium]
MSIATLALPDMTRLSGSGIDFVDEPLFENLLTQKTGSGQIKEIIAKSKNKEALTVEETAVLLNADEPELIEQIFDTARQLKKDVYGNRIVFFAPIYVGNLCMNDCEYCGFRRSNTEQVRRTLSVDELQTQIRRMLAMGHKRTMAVFGEHRNYGPEYIADTVREIYRVEYKHPKSGSISSMRRVNINAAPLSHEGYKIVKNAGIGTYQVFQETYHHATYRRIHPQDTRKGNFMWRLDSPARSIESGCDDVGLGALFGLANWKFEVLSLVAHAAHLMKHYNVGPHTISFPRIRPASGVKIEEVAKNDVADADFLRMIAILRLSVPYTGLIVTAREPAAIRDAALGFGVSQVDAGTSIEIGGYREPGTVQQQALNREQFHIGDERPLDEMIRHLLNNKHIPSFCTACYRLGRTGEVFMEYAKPGFIQNMCTPNALTTLQEYLSDFASPETKAAGEQLLREEIAKLPEGKHKDSILDRIKRIAETDERDLYF